MARTHAGEFVLYVRAGTITAWCFQLSYSYSQVAEHVSCLLLHPVPRLCHVDASDHVRSFVACVLNHWCTAAWLYLNHNCGLRPNACVLTGVPKQTLRSIRRDVHPQQATVTYKSASDSWGSLCELDERPECPRTIDPARRTWCISGASSALWESVTQEVS